jgi:predicted DNA-binding protein (MmcQ/YjbR family)
MSVASESRRLRAACLSLPGAEEVTMRRGPTYRVRGKVFALDRVVTGRPSAWFKPDQGVKAILLGLAAQGAYFSPPYYGPKGWVAAWLDVEVDWEHVEGLLRRSYELVSRRTPPTR